MIGYKYSMFLINPYIYGAAADLLLDTYPAANAYSVRLLTNSYSGALVRIRRSSDSAEKDFYPDTNDELTMNSEDGAGTSLSTWIGANDGFVVTWYDQVGSTDVTQASATTQPKVVNAGALITKGGIAALDFDSSDVLENATGTTALDSGSNSTTAAVVSADFPTGFQEYYLTSSTGTTNSARWGALDRRTQKRCLILYSPTTTLNVANMSVQRDNTDQRLLIDIVDSSRNMSAFDNGATGGTDSYTGDYTNDYLSVGGSWAGGMDGKMQEFIVWSSDESANRSAIETDINGYYSIW